VEHRGERGRARRLDELGRQVEATRARLRALYAQPMDPAEKRRRKREALAPLEPWLERLRGLEGAQPNNALLASYATYTQKLPAFERLLAESGGDLPRFYARVRALADLAPAARDAALR